MQSNVLKYSGLLCCLVVIGYLFFSFRFQQVAALKPVSVHTWRQYDCVAVTDQLYKGKADVWHAKTYYAKDDNSGYAVGELPLVNGLVAALYKTFGKHWYVYRLTVFAFALTGFIFLYLLSWELTANALFSASLPVLVFSSPVVSYYAVSFLPDVPSLALLFAGMYYWVRYYKTTAVSYLGYAVMLFTIAALLKITSAIPLIAVLLVELNYRIVYLRFKKRLLLPVAGLCMVALWYWHAHQLDAGHPTAVFLTEGRGIWQTTALDRFYINRQIWNVWLLFVYPRIAWVVLGSGVLLSFLCLRFAKPSFLLFMLLGLAGCAIFFLALYRQFMWHDYLFVVLIGFFILPLIWAGHALHRTMAGQWLYLYAIIIFSAAYFSSVHAKTELKKRYFLTDNYPSYNPDLFTIESELRRHGIQEDDLVLSIPDHSPNITLAIMQQKGFTNYKDLPSDSVSIQHRICLGVQYLVVSKPGELQNPGVMPFLKTPLFVHESVYVFDVRPYRSLCR